MKRIPLLLPLFSALFLQTLPAQKPAENIKVHKTWVTLIGTGRQVEDFKTVSGGLYSVADSSVVFARFRGGFYQHTPTEVIPIEQIWDIQVRKKGQVGRGVLFGAGIGLLLGATIGLASYTPCKSQPGSLGFDCFLDSPAYDALGGGLVGLIIGGSVGGGIGATHRQIFLVKGKQGAYVAQREKLKNLSLTRH